MENQTNTNKVDETAKSPSFRQELVDIINKHSKENGSDTPDWILAHFVERAIEAFDHATNLRTEWHTCKVERENRKVNKKDIGVIDKIFKMLSENENIKTNEIEFKNGKWVLYVNGKDRMQTESDNIKELLKMVEETDIENTKWLVS